MSIEIPVGFVQEFNGMVTSLAQQRGSLLEDTVMTKMVNGKFAHFERIGAVEAVEITSRHSPTPQSDTPHSRRTVGLRDWAWNDFIDRQDEIRLLLDPTAPYALNAAMALGRQKDKLIIAAVTGNALATDEDDVRSNVALPAANIISEDFIVANSNLTLEKMIEARKKLKQNQIDMSEELFLVVNASAISSLLNTTNVSSSDFNTVKALVSGDVNSYVGFNIRESEFILGTADGTDTDPILCLAYAKSGMGLAVGQDIQIRIDERPDLNYLKQVYGSFTADALRIEEEKVISIKCVQTA